MPIAPFAGRGLIRGFGRWAAEHLDLDLAEAAQILQRAIFIAVGRRHDFESLDRAAPYGSSMGSVCHTFSPEHLERARRVKGSIRDYSKRPNDLLVIQPKPIAPDELESAPDASG